MARLIVFAGLPGSGKSTLARELARRTGAIWLRIDSIDEAIKASGVVPGDMKDVGYRAAHAVAEDNLCLGREVIADCVNDWGLVRDGWQAVGDRAGEPVVWVEIVCSDPRDHQRRVENRPNETPGIKAPDWAAVIGRDYHPWDRDHLTIDTAARGVDACIEELVSRLAAP